MLMKRRTLNYFMGGTNGGRMKGGNLDGKEVERF
jgi:hypothetical protein